jgi:hypothetical protein
MKNKMQNKTSDRKLSIKRISSGLVIAVIILIIILAVDEHYAYLPHYRDIKTLWSPDGDYLVFVRWYDWKNDQLDFFEIWRVDPDGTNPRILYQTADDYPAQGIRSLRFSSDKLYLDMRVNRRNADGNISDKVVKIPTNGYSYIRKWELDKKHEYDVFLAFHNDRVILRRVIQKGSKFSNRILEYSFNERKLVAEHRIPENSLCIEANFYGREERLIGQLSMNYKEKANDEEANGNVKHTHSIYDFKKRKIYFTGFSKTVNITYTENRNSIIFFDSQHLRRIYMLDLSTSDFRAIDFPLKNLFNGKIKLAKDESSIITTYFRSLVLVKLEDMNMKTVPVTDIDSSIHDFDINSDGKQIAFCDQNSLYTIDIEKGEVKTITVTSPKSKLLKSYYYRSYIQFREKVIGRQ